MAGQILWNHWVNDFDTSSEFRYRTVMGCAPILKPRCGTYGNRIQKQQDAEALGGFRAIKEGLRRSTGRGDCNENKRIPGRRIIGRDFEDPASTHALGQGRS